MGNMIQERLSWVIGSLVGAFILGGIAVVVSQAVADEKINQLETRQTIQEQVHKAALDKIDGKLDKIVGMVQKQSVEAARSHHDHK